jgi:hypothetical protein
MVTHKLSSTKGFFSRPNLQATDNKQFFENFISTKGKSDNPIPNEETIKSIYRFRLPVIVA